MMNGLEYSEESSFKKWHHKEYRLRRLRLTCIVAFRVMKTSSVMLYMFVLISENKVTKEMMRPSRCAS